MIDLGVSPVQQLKNLGILMSRAEVLARAKADTGKRDGRLVTKREKLEATLSLISEIPHATD